MKAKPAAVPAGPASGVMAQQEAIATAKYGAMAPKNAAAAMRRQNGMKRFDSADWMMEKGSEGGGKPSLLSRTLQGV